MAAAYYNSAMTLMDAQPYDARKARLRRNIIIGILIAIPFIAAFTWYVWNWPEEHRINRFFAALEAQNYTQAYGLWNSDPNWQQHPDRYKPYDFKQFEADWGPSSDYGVIHSHQILVSRQYGSGVVIGVGINGQGRKNPIFLWVERSTKTIGFSPFELRF